MPFSGEKGKKRKSKKQLLLQTCFSVRRKSPQIFQEAEKRIILKKELLIGILWLLVLSCGKTSVESDWPMILFEADDTNPRVLCVEDSIGIEIGDSNYVFGSIRDLGIASDGSILVLDWINCTIFQFSPSGEFICNVGQRGEGPGEFLQPGFFAVTHNGSICVSDAEQGWTYFGPSGEVLNTSPYSHTRPMQIKAAPFGGILGIRSLLSRGDNCLEVEKRICLWEEENPDSVMQVYLNQNYTFDITDMNRFRRDLIRVDLFPMLFAAGDDFVCIAPSPRNEPLLLVYSTDGSFLDSLELPYPEVPRSDEEIREQKEYMEDCFYTTSQHRHTVDWEPFPNHPMITAMGVDSQNRIWVQRGFEPHPVFDLLNETGGHLETFILPEVHSSDHWTFHLCRYGILAVPETPENFYQVYIVKQESSELR